jgi:HAD superfamily hydrolase (TIGR01509 family)
MPPSPVRSPITLPGAYAGVVTDMDGLLVDTDATWVQAKVILFGRRGVTFHEDDQRAVFGAAEIESATYFAERFGAPDSEIPAIRDEYMDIVHQLFEEPVLIKPGAVELIERLAGRAPLGLASNTRRSLADEILANTPFADHFDAITTGDEVTNAKPAPDVYLLACERLGIKPADAVALEDSPLGVAAAKSAGMDCIGVPSHPDEPLPEADVVVESLAELL